MANPMDKPRKIGKAAVDANPRWNAKTPVFLFTSLRLGLTLALLVGLLAVLPAAAVQAGTLTVTNGNDSGAGSLRQAILDASSGDTITFAGDTTILVTSQLLIAKALTIDGVGHRVTIDAQQLTRIFYVNSGSFTFNLKNLTVANGNAGTNFGGGILNWGTMTVTNCTFIGNSAEYAGGIINTGIMTISNSTFADNAGYYSLGTAGAIDNAGSMTLTNNTFYGNKTDGSAGGAAIYNSGTLNYSNNILANSMTSGHLPTPDCFNGGGGTIGVNLNNLVTNISIPGSRCGSPALTSDPHLAGLADNGGSTPTFALLPGSPAIDAGNDAVCAANPVNNLDQRGEIRPQGDHCDIGAFELALAAKPTTQASAVNFSSVTFTTMTVGWTPGNGSNHLVVVRSGSPVVSDPVNRSSYTANPAFGSGSQIGSGGYVIYNGAGTSVTLTGLTSGVTYYVAVYDFNGSGGTENYLTPGAIGNATTLAVPSVTTQNVDQVGTSTASGNGAITATYGFAITARGMIYYPYTNTDQIIGNPDVINVSEPGSFGTGAFSESLSPLSANRQYNARAYATGVNGTGYGSRVAFWTLANMPSAPTVNNPTPTTLDVTIDANGNPAGTVFMIEDESGNRVQADGSLNSIPVWQDAATWGTITVTGLTPGKTYFFHVEARNGGSTPTDFGPTASGTPGTAPVITSAAEIPFTETLAGAFTVTTTGLPTGKSMTLYETGSLPDGITFTNNQDSAASLAGTPSLGTTGNYPITIHASNGVAPDATQNFTLTVNPAPPTVTINQVADQADPTHTHPVNFTVVFSAPVSGFATGDVDLSTSTAPGTLSGVVTEVAPYDGTTYNVAVSGMIGAGTVTASIPADVARDIFGNPNYGSTSTDNTVTYTPTAATTTGISAVEHTYSTWQTWTLTVNVVSGAGTPTGKVIFREGTTILGTSDLTNGIATLEVTGLSVGAHILTVEFLGSGIYTSSLSDAVIVNAKQYVLLPLVFR
jgi:hypothetical protein